MNWPVTNKPYSRCFEDGEVKANTKSLFWNNIPIKGTDPPLYSTWAKKLLAYIENLPGNDIHIVFDN